ncbi:signal peptide peptidase SppA [Candidatus Poribacteria bacterium]
MLRLIIALSIFALISINAYADTTLLPKAVFLPSYSVAVSDDAIATAFNPAGLAINRGTNAYYFHTFSEKTGGDNAFFISLSGTGFGAEFTNPGPVKFSKYTLSDGTRLFKGMYMGSSYSWFESDRESYDSLSSWDIGLLYRPSNSFSIGLVARNLNRPDFNGVDTDRTYDLALAFRPYTNRLTFSVDTVFREDRSAKDAKFTYAVECEPVDGIKLRGSYDRDGHYGVRIGLGFPLLEVGAYNRFGDDPGSDGGVAYARFSSQQRRTKLRTGRYVLEMEAADLASGQIQDSPLQRAKKDKTVKGVVLKLNASGYSMAKAQEMRDAILDFRTSGKKAICYMELAGNSGYYLAAACDKILLNPAGYLSLNGFRSEVTFYKGILDKIGVEADLYSVGKYKSASEMFTREDMSDAYRESLNSLLDDLSDQMVSGIAEGRDISSDEVWRGIDGGPYTAKEAMNAGLVDDLIYEDQLAEAEEQTFGKGVTKLAAKQYGARQFHKYDWSETPRLAVIYASGTIVPGESMFLAGDMPRLPSLPFPRVMGSETITDAIKKARKDSSIKAIVLRINSGGGSVFASDLIWREVMLAKDEKPVIVSMGGAAASGGYYIATPADVIVAEPGTVTGSIGVIAGKFSLRGIYDKLGIKKEILKKGRNSDIYTSYAGFTDEQREIVNRQIREMYDDFISKVAQGRNMTVEAVEKVAQGRVWTGKQARDNGLVDESGGLQLAASIAKSKMGLKPNESVDIIALPKRVPLWRRLILGDTSFSAEVLGLAPLLEVIGVTERLANERMFFLMPYTIDQK